MYSQFMMHGQKNIKLLVTIFIMLSRMSLLPCFNNSSKSFIHTCFQSCLTKCNHMISITTAWMISGLHRKVDENWTLLGYYAASSGNSLPMFWYNLSVPSSVGKNARPLKKGPINFPGNVCKELPIVAA